VVIGNLKCNSYVGNLKEVKFLVSALGL